MIIPKIWKNKIHVPNHQSVIVYTDIYSIYGCDWWGTHPVKSDFTDLGVAYFQTNPYTKSIKKYIWLNHHDSPSLKCKLIFGGLPQFILTIMSAVTLPWGHEKFTQICDISNNYLEIQMMIGPVGKLIKCQFTNKFPQWLCVKKPKHCHWQLGEWRTQQWSFQWQKNLFFSDKGGIEW